MSELNHSTLNSLLTDIADQIRAKLNKPSTEKLSADNFPTLIQSISAGASGSTEGIKSYLFDLNTETNAPIFSPALTAINEGDILYSNNTMLGEIGSFLCQAKALTEDKTYTSTLQTDPEESEEPQTKTIPSGTICFQVKVDKSKFNVLEFEKPKKLLDYTVIIVYMNDGEIILDGFDELTPYDLILKPYDWELSIYLQNEAGENVNVIQPNLKNCLIDKEGFMITEYYPVNGPSVNLTFRDADVYTSNGSQYFTANTYTLDSDLDIIDYTYAITQNSNYIDTIPSGTTILRSDYYQGTYDYEMGSDLFTVVGWNNGTEESPEWRVGLTK